MKRFVLFIVGLALTGCSKKAAYDVAPEFEPYVKAFEKASVENGRPVSINNIVIKFGSLSNASYAAYCETGEVPTITVREWWKDIEPTLAKERILFHEFGHCVLGRMVHINEYDERGLAKSIMASAFRESDYTEETRAAYLKELFGNQTTPFHGQHPTSLIK